MTDLLKTLGLVDDEEAEGVPASAAQDAAPEPEQPDESAGPSPAQAEAAAPKEERPEPDHVPVKALVEERRRRQEAERRAEELEARKGATAPERPAPPDPLRDPEAFARAVDEKIETARREATLSFSRTRAEGEHGAELVAAAEAAFLEAGNAARARGEPFGIPREAQGDPYRFLLDWKRRQDSLAAIGDPVTYEERLREKLRAEMEAEFASRAPAAPPKPTLPKPLNGVASGRTSHKGAAGGADVLRDQFGL